jgi:putative nucleotidyltransferase with HDIG domain
MTYTIDSIVKGIPSMGSYGGIIRELEQVLEDPQSTLVNVAEVIEKEPDVTARLLRLGNSSFYGFPSRLETVFEAISLIGIQQVQDLIAASNVIEIFKGVSAEFVSMESFWKHSLACGVAARLLAIEQRVAKPEKFFVAGLLHDIGRMAIYARTPQLARQIFLLCQSQPMLMIEAEVRIMGFDHTTIGAELLRTWNYPANLIHAVGHHHQPITSGAFQLEASLVHLANYLVAAMELGSSGEHRVAPLNRKAWDRINLPLDVLGSLMDNIDNQIEAVEDAFLTTPALS